LLNTLLVTFVAISPVEAGETTDTVLVALVGTMTGDVVVVELPAASVFVVV
jgi:hypothetical protein